MDNVIAGSLIGGGINLLNGIGTNLTNYTIANKNLRFQKQNLEYQKALQQQIFDREDTAYTRKVEDLRNAGLNPALALGGSGLSSGSVVSTSAPQLDFKAQPLDVGSAFDYMKALQQLDQSKEQTELIKEQKEYYSSLKNKVDNEALNIAFNNDILSDTKTYKVDLLKNQYLASVFDTLMLKRQEDLNRMTYNYMTGKPDFLNFNFYKAPLYRELSTKNDLLKLQYDMLNSQKKGQDNSNNAFWWKFGLDSLNSLSNTFSNLSNASTRLARMRYFGF